MCVSSAKGRLSEANATMDVVNRQLCTIVSTAVGKSLWTRTLETLDYQAGTYLPAGAYVV